MFKVDSWSIVLPPTMLEITAEATDHLIASWELYSVVI